MSTTEKWWKYYSIHISTNLVVLLLSIAGLYDFVHDDPADAVYVSVIALLGAPLAWELQKHRRF